MLYRDAGAHEGAIGSVVPHVQVHLRALVRRVEPLDVSSKV